MLIISFAWTTPQLLQGIKTVTRRAWDDKFAQRFLDAAKRGDEIQAYNKSPRNGGKCVGFINIISMKREWLCEMTAEDEQYEGGLWGSAENFILANQEHLGDKPWRIEFTFRKNEEVKP